jgi:hypothetical protein
LQGTLAERMTTQFNGCVTCGLQVPLPIFGMVEVSEIFSTSVMLLMRAISRATDWTFYATTLPALALGCQT